MSFEISNTKDLPNIERFINKLEAADIKGTNINKKINMLEIEQNLLKRSVSEVNFAMNEKFASVASDNIIGSNITKTNNAENKDITEPIIAEMMQRINKRYLSYLRDFGENIEYDIKDKVLAINNLNSFKFFILENNLKDMHVTFLSNIDKYTDEIDEEIKQYYIATK